MGPSDAPPTGFAACDAIVESLSVGVVRLDAARVVTLVNSAFARIAAVGGDSARAGRTLEHAIGPVNAAELRPMIDGAFGGHRSPRDVQLHSVAGIHDVHASFAPEWSGDGAIVAVVGTLTEITESKQAERQRAHHDARVRDDILSAVSHEMRSPLNGVQSWSHVLETQLARVDVDPVAARALDGIRAGVRQQVALIDRLLDATAALTGELEMAVGPIVVRRVIEESVTEASAAAAAKGVTLRAAVAVDDEQVSGDAQRLRQMFVELLSNAIRFAPAGGNVHVAATADAHALTVVVADDGRGLPSGFDAWLFQPFRQADGPSARRASGLGLGLAVAQRLARRHGGGIEAASAGPGLGATFTVTLPLCDRPPARGTGSESATATGPAIDDEVDGSGHDIATGGRRPASRAPAPSRRRRARPAV